MGEQLAAAAKLGFKDFRVDFEKVSNAASKSGYAQFYVDYDWDLRIPLQRRYAEAGAFDAIAKYHATIFRRYKGRNEPWPDEPAWGALYLFAEYGVPQKGVALVRAYIDMQQKRLQRDYSTRNARGPRRDLDETTKMALRVTNKLIAEAIPDAKRQLMSNL